MERIKWSECDSLVCIPCYATDISIYLIRKFLTKFQKISWLPNKLNKKNIALKSINTFNDRWSIKIFYIFLFIAHEQIFALINNTLWKNCSLLKTENNSSLVNFTQFRENMRLLAVELMFINSTWRVYMCVKFNI